MKNIFLKPIVLMTLSLAVFTSCVKEDDYAIPTLNKVFYVENFEGIANPGTGSSISLPGWSNVSINNGASLWEARSYSGNIYAQLSAFNTGEASMNTWLITAPINLDETINEYMFFQYKIAYYNGNAVSVLISQDYDGTATVDAINNATWTNLNIDFPDYLTSGYPNDFSNTIPVDISSYSGNVYIAFRYNGGSSGITSTYQIDNIKIFEKN